MIEISDAELVYKLQKAQKSILIELDRVCGILGLTYCLAFGSALGAVRHKGFIPWDDDIDVYMRIEDLEILHSNAELFNKEFFLQHHESDPEFGLMISRLRNSNTTLIEKTEIHRNINHGIFIDIYPLFSVPNKGVRFTKIYIASMVYRLLLYGEEPKNRGKLMKIGSTVLLKMTTLSIRHRIIMHCYHIMRNAKHTGYLSSLYGDESKIRYPEGCIFPVKWVQFDDIRAPIEGDADKYLTLTYGDYMEMPPLEKRVFHHGYEFVDFNRPYMEYKGKKYCKGKEV